MRWSDLFLAIRRTEILTWRESELYVRVRMTGGTALQAYHHARGAS